MSLSGQPAVAGSATLLPPAVAGTLAFHLGVGDNWPILVVGVALGLLAKAAVTTSSGHRYEWSYLRNDLLMAGFLVAAAGFVVERWTAAPPFPVTTYGELLLSAGLAIGGDRVRALAAWIAIGAAGRAMGLPQPAMPPIPPADPVSPVNAHGTARPLVDPRAEPIAQYGSRLSADEAVRAGLHQPHDDELLRRLPDA